MATQVQSVCAAVVQAAPVAFDRERTLEKVRTLTAEAASQGAQIVVFPEAFVSAYPRGLTFGAVVGHLPMDERAGLQPCSISRWKAAASSSPAFSLPAVI